MGTVRNERLRYGIFDPTGNVTALVASAVEPARQPDVAASIMGRHPEVEQVGFLRQTTPAPDASTGEPAALELRMAGGEFCGNATMSAAAWCLLHGLAPSATVAATGAPIASDAPAQQTVLLRVSGASAPVEVRLRQVGDDAFDACVRMPAALGIDAPILSFDGTSERCPVVRMEGISHAIIEPTSVFFALRDQPRRAERAVRAWCAELAAEGLGLMFVEPASEPDADGRAGEPSVGLTPLVFIPAGDTIFWEHSCASGSAAVGMLRAARSGARTALSLREPGGILRVRSDPQLGETWLCGSTRLVAEREVLV